MRMATHPELSLFTHFENHKADLYAANSKGAEQLIAELNSKKADKKKKYPGEPGTVARNTPDNRQHSYTCTYQYYLCPTCPTGSSESQRQLRTMQTLHAHEHTAATHTRRDR